MKISLTYVLIGLLSLPLQALQAQDEVVQNHPEYYQDGDYWVQAVVPWNFEECLQEYDEIGFYPKISVYAFYVEGDTIIDHKEYKCIHAKSWGYDGEPTYEHQPEGLFESLQVRNVLFMREDADGRQWRRLANLDDEALLFDFSKPFEVNQTFRYCRHRHLSEFFDDFLQRTNRVSTSARVQESEGVADRRSEEAASWAYDYDMEIQEVGTTELSNGKQVPLANGQIAFGWGNIKVGDLWNQFSPDEESSEGRFLYRVHQGQIVIQDQENQNNISKVIKIDVKVLVDDCITAVRDIPSDPIVNRKSVNGQWYDLSGRRLTTPPTKGIYIRDGKKVMRICAKE